jgi:predicted transcriptional regulator
MNTEINFEENVKKVTNLILTNQKKMIREDDLKNLCQNPRNFTEIIDEVYQRLKDIGFVLIKSQFLNQTYYVLTSQGKDDSISPSQYGTLAMIIALTKEVNEELRVGDLKEIFSEVWDTDIQFLIENDYLREIQLENLKIVKVTPLGKAIMKDIIQNLKLKNLIEIFQQENTSS